MSDAGDLTVAAAAASARPAWLERLAHDLRSAYSPVSLGITMLRGGRLDAAQEAELLAAMQRQSEVLVQMFDDVADLVAARAGSRSATSLATLFGEVAARTTGRLADIEATLDIQVPDAPATVRGEARALVRLLSRIVVQTAQIGGRGSRVIVSAGDDADVLRVTLDDAGAERRPDAFASLVARLGDPAAPHLVDAAAHAIAVRHGARLTACDDPPGVALRLPAQG